MDERPRALEILDVFLGEWILEASIAPPGVTGRAVFEWALGRTFLMERSEAPGAPSGICVIGANGDGRTYTQHYFDSRGIARLYAMTFEDGVWILSRSAPDFTPLDFWQRYVGEFNPDGSAIVGRWETSPDGTTWEKDFELTYRRTD